ncbi:MAG: ATP-dependent zinc metalloprotease FtsH [Planctomycetota bacterium]
MADDQRNRRPQGPDGDEQPPRFGRGRGLLIWLILVAAVIFLVSLDPGRMTSAFGKEKPTFNQVLDAIRAGQIDAVVVRGDKLKVRLREGAPEKEFPEAEFAIPISVQVVEQLTKEINAYNAEKPKAERVDIEFEPPSTLLMTLVNMLPWMLLFVILYWMLMRQLRGASSGVFSFGRSRAKVATPEETTITFDDVAGIDEAKHEVMEIIEFLKSPEKFRRLGGRVPRGVLLVGPPGSGKTLLAKAIAGEAGRPFFSISGSDFVEMFVGVGASRVRDLFRQAKEHAPCIVFLDEIDAVGRRRGTGLGGGHDEREQTLNAILVEMDGFESDVSVILVAATNRPDVLDPALLRPGRFDRRVMVDQPDVKGREAILKVHARTVKLAGDVDLKVIARGTPYFSGADLENLLNEAALLAARRDRDAVTMTDLEDARDKVMWGPEKKSRVVAEEEKRLTAYHETGHAVVSMLLPEVEPVHKVSIVARGMALGATMYLPEKDRYIIPRKRIVGEIVSLLGGRAAEQGFCDDITSGAQNDFERATELARMMVCRWGMSDKLGPMSYSDNEEHLFLGREVTKVKSVSEATAVVIDQEVRRILDECYQKARDLLDTHRDAVQRIVDALMRYESIDGEEVKILMDGGTLDRPENHTAQQAQLPEDESPAAPQPEHGPQEGETDESDQGEEDEGAEAPPHVDTGDQATPSRDEETKAPDTP